MAGGLIPRMEGPLAPFAPGFDEALVKEGYAQLTRRGLLVLVGQLSAWLERRGLQVDSVTMAVLEQFLCERNVEASWKPTTRTLMSLWRYLRDQGVVVDPAPAALSPVGALCERYARYLSSERGLAQGTIENYVGVAEQFLAWVGLPQPAGQVDLTAVVPEAVSRFVTAQAARGSVGSAKNVVTGLKSLLGWLQVRGDIPGGLAEAVPSVAGWAGDALPKAFTATQVERLLAGCDRECAAGQRDYAVMLLMLRLGLRAGEVAALQLRDFDWRAGEVVVHGKGNTFERLPLPADVGEAVVAYLHHSRPQSNERAVFLRAHAPRTGLTSTGVADIVHSAGKRAGIAGANAHRLRHTAATAMLRAGASLPEVALVLRHRSSATTARYAKVDHNTLRGLARPWPGSR